MLNFIICDDNEYVRNLNETHISRIMMPYDFDYKVYSFEKYDKNLSNIIKDKNDSKIYLLDIEMPGKSGIEIASMIRQNDWDSIIIILTSHQELELEVLRKRLLIFDFISKFDNYEEKIKYAVEVLLNKMNNNKTINVKYENELYQIKIDDILYIYKDIENEKTAIVTEYNTFYTRDTLISLFNKLGPTFIKTHRACYVNYKKIRKLDLNNNIIYFTKKINTNLISRNYKKELREKIEG